MLDSFFATSRLRFLRDATTVEILLLMFILTANIKVIILAKTRLIFLQDNW